MIHFDPTAHAYFLDGKKLPNVTSILAPLSTYAGVPQHILETAAERGNYVHKACEMLIWETLDEDSLSEESKPYIAAFKKFLADTGFAAEQTEERIFHKTLLYAGTLDIGGVFPVRGRMKKPKRALVDLKTTFKLLQSVGPQTAAYFEAWNSTHEKDEQFEERYGLQLKKDGTYKLNPYKSLNDMNIFRSCLAVYNFIRSQS